MRVTPVAPVIPSQDRRYRCVPYTQPDRMWCSQHRAYTTRKGCVQVPIDALHYRVVCAACARRMKLID